MAIFVSLMLSVGGAEEEKSSSRFSPCFEDHIGVIGLWLASVFVFISVRAILRTSIVAKGEDAKRDFSELSPNFLMTASAIRSALSSICCGVTSAKQ